MTADEKKSIYLIINRLSGGGAESLFRTYSRRLIRDNKFKVTLVSLMDDKIVTDIELSESDKYLGLNLKRTPIRGLKEFIQHAKRDKPNVIHSWLYISNLLSSLVIGYASFRPSIVWHVHHSDLTFKNNSLVAYLSIHVSGLISKIVRPKIVFVSEKALKRHKAAGWFIGRSKVIFNAIDYERLNYTRASYSSMAEGSSELRKVGLVGRFDKIKNVPVVLESLSEYFNYSDVGADGRIYLIGEGMNYDNMELTDIIDRYDLSDKVNLLGFQQNVDKWYSELDIIISMSKDESFGLVLAEGLVCGVLCLSTLEADPMEFCSGVLRLENATPQALLDTMKKLSNVSRKDLDSIISERQEYITSRFSFERFSKELFMFYGE